MRRVVEAARKVERILANLFEPRSFLDVIKEIGVGTTGFFFKLSVGRGRFPVRRVSLSRLPLGSVFILW